MYNPKCIGEKTHRENRYINKGGGGYMRFFLSVVSLVLIIEGVPYFMFPHRFKEMIKLLEQMEDSHLRVLGLIMMICGLILLYLSRL